MRALWMVVMAAGWVVSSAAQQAHPDGKGAGLRCTAFAVSMGGPGAASGTSPLDIVVDRWSTDAEREQLLTALKQDQDALLDTLRELRPVGRIRTPTSVGWELRYANAHRGEDGGRRIVIGTDRPMDVAEAINRPRTVDYPFTFIELHLDDSGEGEGKMSIATRVAASGRFVQLENYASQPVQLNQVRCKEGSIAGTP